MFSGIVAGAYSVTSVESSPTGQRLVLDLNDLSEDLIHGASVSVNGVCLTATSIDNGMVGFDVVNATLKQSNLRLLTKGSAVNVERSIKFGDEIGGHLLSGHIADVVTVLEVNQASSENTLTFVVPTRWRKYFHNKGFIALNGVSLTLAAFDYQTGTGVVNLVPETLKRTNLGAVSNGSLLNFEVDPATLAVVDSVERHLQQVHAIQEVLEDVNHT